MNPLDPHHRFRLTRADSHWKRQFDKFYRARKQLIEEYASLDYVRDSTEINLPDRPAIFINVLQQYVIARTSALAYGTPQCQMSTFRADQKATASRLETAVNEYAKKIVLKKAIRAMTIDAQFGWGVGKIFMEEMPAVQTEYEPAVIPGYPYCMRVSPDDFIFDGSHGDFRKAHFMRDRYLIRLDKAMERFPGVEDRLSRYQDFEGKHSRSRNIGLSDNIEDSYVDPMCELADVWLPDEKLIIIQTIDPGGELSVDPPLDEIPWEGPDSGPYPLLTFLEVPDQALPSAPVMGFRGQFVLLNSLFRKLADRAENMKDLFGFVSGSEVTADRIRNYPDLSSFKLEHPNAFEHVKAGGISPELMNFTYGVYNLCKQSAGEPLAGAAASAKTATQAAFINSESLQMESWERARLDEFVAEIFEGLSHLFWSQDVSQRAVEEIAPGIPVDASWGPQVERVGDFSELSIDVVPYSMAYKSPSQKFGEMAQMLQFFTPMLEQMAAMGFPLNPPAILQSAVAATGSPEFLDWFSQGVPMQVGPAAGRGASGPREYIRHNVSHGPTPDGIMAQMFQQNGAA